MGTQHDAQRIEVLARKAINISLITLGGAILCYVAFNKFHNGWLRIVDVYLIAFGALVLLSIVFPLAVKANLFVLLTAIFAVEGIFGFVIWLQTPSMKTAASSPAEEKREFYVRDEYLGYRPAVNGQLDDTKWMDNELVYQARYTVDEHGRRTVPVKDGNKEYTDFLVFFGCSFTFGAGVNDDQTLPYYVGRLVDKYKPYNYAFNGYGPQHMLARLERGDVEQQINETNGKFFYVFIDDHVKRVVNTMQTTYTHFSPYYMMDLYGRLVRNGNFNVARPYLYALYHDVLLWSSTLKFFNIDLPLINDGHIALTAKVLEEARNQIRRRFHTDEFYVIIFPGGGSEYGESQYAATLVRFLDASKIKYLDYSKVPFRPDNYLHKYEHHPNPQTNQFLARLLVKDLGLVMDNAFAHGR